MVFNGYLEYYSSMQMARINLSKTRLFNIWQFESKHQFIADFIFSCKKLKRLFSFKAEYLENDSERNCFLHTTEGLSKTIGYLSTRFLVQEKVIKKHSEDVQKEHSEENNVSARAKTGDSLEVSPQKYLSSF